MQKTVQVTLNRGISSIKNKMKKNPTSGNFFRVSRFTQKEENRDTNGSRMGDYNHQAFARSEQAQMPHYCGVKGTYRWGGTTAKFIELVNKIGMKYPKTYRDESLRGAFIKLEKNDTSLEQRKSDYWDPIFSNTIFRDNAILFEGQGVWNLSNPILEFVYLTQIDALDVSTKDRPRRGARLLLKDSKIDVKSTSNDIKNNIEATKLFSAIFDDEDKLSQIAFILNVKGVGKNTESAALQQILHDTVIHNQTMCSSYGKSYRNAFIELCKMPGSDLEVQYEVAYATSKRIVRKKSDRYEFEDNVIPVKSREKLIEFLLKEENVSIYMDLKTAIEDAKTR